MKGWNLEEQEQKLFNEVEIYVERLKSKLPVGDGQRNVDREEGIQERDCVNCLYSYDPRKELTSILIWNVILAK